MLKAPESEVRFLPLWHPEAVTQPPDPPSSKLPTSLQRRGFGLTLLIVEFGVLSSLLLSLALYIFGTVQTVRELWHALPSIGQPAATRNLLISAIEQTDVLLVATALLIISVGLQALFEIGRASCRERVYLAV